MFMKELATLAGKKKAKTMHSVGIMIKQPNGYVKGGEDEGGTGIQARRENTN